MCVWLASFWLAAKPQMCHHERPKSLQSAPIEGDDESSRFRLESARRVTGMCPTLDEESSAFTAWFLLTGWSMRGATQKVSGSPTRATASLVVPTQSADAHAAHVLVAACDAGVREARERQLAACGLRVRVARTGFEAIVKASCHLPSLILLDASLGSEEVEETSRLLATCPSTAHIPIVRLTPRRRVPRRMIEHLTTAAVL
jgi:CheY-like chemotaxis protein